MAQIGQQRTFAPQWLAQQPRGKKVVRTVSNVWTTMSLKLTTIPSMPSFSRKCEKLPEGFVARVQSLDGLVQSRILSFFLHACPDCDKRRIVGELCYCLACKMCEQMICREESRLCDWCQSVVCNPSWGATSFGCLVKNPQEERFDEYLCRSCAGMLQETCCVCSKRSFESQHCWDCEKPVCLSCREFMGRDLSLPAGGQARLLCSPCYDGWLQCWSCECAGVAKNDTWNRRSEMCACPSCLRDVCSSCLNDCEDDAGVLMPCGNLTTCERVHDVHMDPLCDEEGVEIPDRHCTGLVSTQVCVRCTKDEQVTTSCQVCLRTYSTQIAHRALFLREDGVLYCVACSL